MLRRQQAIRFVLAVWFSMLLLLGNTPMEFIHLFAGHRDTVHHRHQGLVIENKHHHCAFLSLTLTSFINDYQLPFVPRPVVRHTVSPCCYRCLSMQQAILHVNQRGPPVS